MRLKRNITLFLAFSIVIMFTIAKLHEKEQDEIIYTIKDDFSATGLVIDEAMEILKIPNLRSEAITEDEFTKKIFSENNIFELKQRYMSIDENRKCLPMAKATIVFAIDKTKVKEKIDSWKKLIESDYKILISHKNKDLGVSSLLAMNLGLGYDEKNLDRANDIVERMERENRIEYLNEHIERDMNLINISKASINPIMILWDYQAAYIKENINRDIDIVIPKDGSFTTNMGIVANIKKGKESKAFSQIEEFFKSKEGKELIIKNGFRTIDNLANRDLFPDEREYKSTLEIKDYAKYNEHLFNFYKSRGRLGIRERIIFVSFIVVIWALYTYLRFPKCNIRKYFIFVSALLLFWSSMKFIRVHVENYHTRVFWYLYYVPMNMIPTIFFYLFYEYRFKKKIPRNIKITILLVSIFFIIMAFTNEYHNYFFHVHLESNSLKAKYEYGIFYYLDMLWVFCLTVISLRNIFATFKYKSKRNIKLVLIGYCCMIISYNILYSNEITKLDLTTTMIMIVLVAMELIIRFIIVENRYMRYSLFNRVNTAIGVLDDNFQTIYLNAYGKEIENDIDEEYIKSKIKDSHIYKFRLNGKLKDNYICNADKLEQGYLITLNDISTINKLNDAIKLRNMRLNNRKELLDRKKHVIEERSSLEISKRIFDAIEEEIEGSLNLLKQYLKEVYDKKDIKYNADHIYILCRYIKQRAQMSVLEIKKEKLNKSRVEKIFNDLISEFRNNELDFYIVIAGEDCFSLEDLLILHEYMYHILIVHYECENTSIYCRIFNYKDMIKVTLNLNLSLKDKAKILEEIDMKLRDTDCGTVTNIFEEDGDLIIEFEVKKGGDYIVD